MRPELSTTDPFKKNLPTLTQVEEELRERGMEVVVETMDISNCGYTMALRVAVRYIPEEEDG